MGLLVNVHVPTLEDSIKRLVPRGLSVTPPCLSVSVFRPVVGALVWWFVDSAASILTGYPMNAVSNTGFLLVIGAAWWVWRRNRPARS